MRRITDNTPTWLLSTAVATLLAATPAGAAGMSASNLGQPGMRSDPPQPALALASRGSCAEVLTAEQIEGAPSSCAPGSWPPTGERAWGPELDMAFGDTIELRFDHAVNAVRFSSTTDGKPGGQAAPDGQVAYNRQILGPAEAAPTSDPARWLVSLPNPMHPLARTGVTFAVVAEAASGPAEDYALSIRGPRAAHWAVRYDEQNCGPAWFSPEDVSTTCPQAFPIPSGPGPCPLAALAAPGPEGSNQFVVVGQPQPCPPPGRTREDFTVTTDFGDGTVRDTPFRAADELWFIGGDHAYRRAGRYELEATVVDRETNESRVYRRSVVVPNAVLKPRAHPRPAFSVTRRTRRVVGAFTDGNRLAESSDYRVAVAWDDGRRSRGKVVRRSAGRFSVVAAHRYRTARRRRIVVTVRDDRRAELKLRTTPRLRG